MLNGISNKVRGDGDSHMRGMSCLLTGIELLPGNIQGGGGNPAGWASGISIDQEIKNFLQSRPETRTRFGSLEFGVAVPDRADPWTRMSYAGANQPIAPVDDPYQMFGKLYGRMKDTREPREHPRRRAGRPHARLRQAQRARQGAARAARDARPRAGAGTCRTRTRDSEARAPDAASSTRASSW